MMRFQVNRSCPYKSVQYRMAETVEDEMNIDILRISPWLRVMKQPASHRR